MSVNKVAFCFILSLVLLMPSFAGASSAPLVYSSTTNISLMAPVVTLSIQAGSVATSVAVNSGSLVVGMSTSNGGIFILTSPKALVFSIVGAGGNVTQTCLSGIQTNVIIQTNGLETYTFTPAGFACAESNMNSISNTVNGNASALVPSIHFQNINSQLPQPPNTTINSINVQNVPLPSTPSFIFLHYLSYGDNGNDVFKLQQRLVKLHFLSVSPNGHYGPATTIAIKKFQKAHGIAQTGNVASLTLKAINNS